MLDSNNRSVTFNVLDLKSVVGIEGCHLHLESEMKGESNDSMCRHGYVNEIYFLGQLKVMAVYHCANIKSKPTLLLSQGH